MTIKPYVPPIIRQKPIPDIPDGMSYEQGVIWLEFFEALDEGWVTPNQYPMAANYCRHVDASNRIAAMIDLYQQTLSQSIDQNDIKSLDRLYGMQERESRAINAIMRSLRLTNMSLRSDKSKPPIQAMPKPWEVTMPIPDEALTIHEDEGNDGQ